ncbi:hypothetical protein SDC9_202835 [bioreactor metagenome]|uniref:Uncharacterized protein n=1 Tax=bioreactor metagenome TaxID=1076179 RepID=A0A645IVF3_9ZZZZ
MIPGCERLAEEVETIQHHCVEGQNKSRHREAFTAAQLQAHSADIFVGHQI